MTDRHLYIEARKQVGELCDDIPVNAGKKNRSDLVAKANIRKFINDGTNSCYANSTLQCLLNFRAFINQALSAAASPFKQVFVDANNSSHTESIDLTNLKSEFVQAMPAEEQQRDVDDQQCAMQFLQFLFDKYPYMKTPCRFIEVNQTECTSCSYKSTENQETFFEYLGIPPAQQKSIKIDALIDHNIGKWHLQTDSHCGECHATLRRKTTIENSNDVLVFAIRLEDSEGRKNQKIQISGVSQTPLTINGSKYEFTSAIFHIGTTFKMGHYFAIVRKKNQLFSASDETIDTTIWPKNSKGLYVLMYRRLDSKK